MRLENKSAIVTGAAGGIGAAISKLFAKEGASVVAADINAEGLDSIVTEITEAGGKAIAVPGDIASEAYNKELVEKAVSTYGKLDILINNAGILDNLTPLHDVEKDLWDRVMAINVTGPAFLSKEAVKVMKEQKSGSIVFVSSLAGVNGGRAGASYTASKHAVVGLARSIAWFYEPYDIRCNAVCPGGILTPLVTGLTPNDDGMKRYEPYLDTSPRFAEPEEVATAILFLASDEASYVSGVVMNVDKAWASY